MAAEPKIPIVLGVTGHRQIAPDVWPRLQAKVEEILLSFRTRFEGTPVILFSSLAEGADQLCAEVALTLQMRVIAPLPFPAEVYRGSTSFDTEQARDKLHAFLEQDMVESFVVPLPNDMMPAVDADWEKLRDDDAKRRACYANCGAYVALHCHALLALWDGVVTDSPGGTAQVVRFKLTGEPPDHYPWNQPLFSWADSGPVYVIHTPRSGGASQNAGQVASGPSFGTLTAGDYRELYPGAHLSNRTPSFSGKARRPERAQQAAERRQFIQTCRTIHDFNRETHALGHAATQAAAGAAGSSLEERGTQPVSGSTLIEQRLKDMGKFRAAAGQLARKHHTRIERLTIILFGLLFLALLCLHLYAHYPGHDHAHYPLFLSLFLALLVLAFVVVFCVWFGHFERKWMDFRSLAEALRVQLYWCRSGINASAADNYLQQVRSDLTWVRRAVRSCSPPPHLCSEAFGTLTSKQQCEALDKVRMEWVQVQKNFFAQHVSYHRNNARFRFTGFGLAVLGWLLAVLMLIISPRDPHPWLLVSSECWSSLAV